MAQSRKTSRKSVKSKPSPDSASAQPKPEQPQVMERIPLRITDTTLRDAHQSLWATRMRTTDIMGVIDDISAVGYYSLEVWGGATFDACMRFLRENPWERLRQIKAKAKNIPLQMLLRGQNILGYQHYPDDVVDRFVAMACENGVDIFRCFDALNDTRNLEKAIVAIKKHGGHAQGTICYTTSPFHTVDRFVGYAREQVAMGIDSLCIKDMAGILSPISAERLIKALMKEIKVPIQIHTHATSGMGTATYVEGVRAGAGAIDCAISVMASYSSQPPVETMLAIFDETPYHANLDVEALGRVRRYFTELAPKRQVGPPPLNVIDPEILLHHIPGGMISNLRSQLQQQQALDRLPEVLEELPKVRADLGYPPLVTPTSQIVGVQAVLNVLAGQRYKMVTQETKNYVKGLYGRPPAPIGADIVHKIIGKEKRITRRPADLLKPGLPKATMNIDAKLIKSEEDILSFCLFPEVAVEYFKWRALPMEDRPSTPADIELKSAKTDVPPPAPPPPPFLALQDYKEIQQLLEKVRSLDYDELVIRRRDMNLSLRTSGATTARAPADDQPETQNGTDAAPPPAPEKPEAEKSEAVKKDANGPSIKAPLNGTFYTSGGPGKPAFVKEGDTVKAGDPVCIVEAMKLFNEIRSPSDCKIVRLLVEHGRPVQKDQPLILIEPR